MPSSGPRRNAAERLVLRSVLLTPAGESPSSGDADAVLIDPFVDSGRGVPFARERGPLVVFARVSADETKVDGDLDAIMPGAPDGVAIAGFGDGGTLALLAARIAAREAICGLPDGSTSIMAIVAEAADLVQLASLRGSTPRLAALGWDAAALAADIGAVSAWDNGVLIGPLAIAQGLCLAAAAAAGVPAIDTALPPGTANADFMRQAATARAHGFRGKFARSREEARILNEIFAGNAVPAGSRP